MPTAVLDLTTTRKFAEQLAHDAGALLRRYANEGFEVTHKGAIDLVTTADRESEQLIVSAIREQFPSHAIMSEEDRTQRLLRTQLVEYCWIVDPLDGTTNFVHHYSAFAVSIALYRQHHPLIGVIYDPTLDELFSAQRDGPALLNQQPIQVSSRETLIESMLTSGFPYDVQETSGNVTPYLQLMRLTQAVRISGSAALDMAWVACGRLDGYWEPTIAPWDVAAGTLLVRAAGGRVTDYADADWMPTTPSVVATNGRVHLQLLKEIGESGSYTAHGH